ncbi:MAG: TRAP transporter small permease [Rhodocyclales bacterium]|nr:TRAP transporter small permease [Rhodocyclales bacterium]
MGKLIYDVSRVMAWFGGLVLTLVAVISVFSIAGRALSFAGLGPVPGDFELVEAGTALAVFCFLPWCHLKRSHADVAMLWHAYPAPMRRALEILGDALMFAVWALLIWRMGLATHEYSVNNEVSFILQMPVWWGYAASLLPALLGCVVYAWRLLETLGLAAPQDGFTTAEGGH